MKVKSLASLSTAQGWRSVGEEFTVNAAEADALVERGLVERLDVASLPAADSQSPKGGKEKA